MAEREDQCLDTRGGDGQQGVCAHGSESIPSSAELYLGAVVGVVSGLLRMSAVVGLLGRGCLGTSGVSVYVLLLPTDCRRARRTERSMLGSRARASWWAPWSRSGVVDSNAGTGRDQ